MFRCGGGDGDCIQIVAGKQCVKIMDKRHSGGVGSCLPSSRSASRSSRLARLRATAPPTLRLTTRPALAGPLPVDRLATYSTTVPCA